MNFANIKSWTIPEGEVTKVTDSQNRVIWMKDIAPEPVTLQTPFFVENISDEVETLSIQKYDSSDPTLNIYYSTDKNNWQTLGTTSTTPLTKTLQPGDRIYLRCNASIWNDNNITGVSKVGGNIMSLLYGSNFTGQETTLPNNGYNTHTFSYLFYNNNTLIDANDLLLPATTMLDDCYMGIFAKCSSLQYAPALPATTLAYRCYWNLFSYCTSLINAPALPATILANYCYFHTFSYCTSLINAPALPATTLAEGCYQYMFEHCESLVNAPALPATTLANYCYGYMFASCDSLVNAPDLLAPVLVKGCYDHMFYFAGINNLTLKCLATSGINTNDSTKIWLSIDFSTCTFYKKAGVTWPTGTSGIPSRWTVVEV